MKRLRPLLLAIAVVSGAALSATMLLLVRDGEAISRAFAAAIGPSILFGFIGLASRYPCRAIPLRGGSISRLVAAHAGGAVAASGLWLLSWNVWLPLVDGPAIAASTIFGLGAILYALTVTVQYLLIEVETSRRAEEAALQYQVLAREAELKAFKAQIDPHFLFNSLNAVASLCGTRPMDAREMAQRLADFFRYTLRLGGQDRVPLEQELELVSRYLAIEKVRFGERLGIDISADDAAKTRMVPPLVLQPLVENAVRHGIASMVEGGRVSIRASAEEGPLRITIENPADPDRADVKGEKIGLQNARGRLAAVSGGRSSLHAEERDGVFRVSIEVPA